MRTMTKLLTVLALVMALCGAFTLSAHAWLIDFDITPNFPSEPPQGVISYAQPGGPLTGVEIAVDSVVGIGTPLNSNMVVPVHAVLTFTTGNFSGANSNTWFFSPGGSITIFGTFGNGPPEILLSGYFTDPAVVGFGLVFKIAGGTYADYKADSICDFFGIPEDLLLTGGLNISFNAVSGPPDINSTFTSSQVISGDASNVPLPASLLLLGSGLVGMGLLGVRRKKLRVE